MAQNMQCPADCTMYLIVWPSEWAAIRSLHPLVPVFEVGWFRPHGHYGTLALLWLPGRHTATVTYFVR